MRCWPCIGPIKRFFKTLSAKTRPYSRGLFYYHSRSDIANLHMSIVKIKRVGQSEHILPIHVKEVTTEENQ